MEENDSTSSSLFHIRLVYMKTTTVRKTKTTVFIKATKRNYAEEDEKQNLWIM